MPDRGGMTVLPDPGPAGPAARAAELGASVDAATGNLLQTAAGISDEQARAASLLPGWSRGHVLTHLARNADSLRNLLIWARTGVETPQYPSPEAREQGVAAGAGKPAAELLADLGTSAAALAAEAKSLADADWQADVRGLRGAPHPAWYTMWRRLSEVEIHHVDLDAGYGPADWPEQFAAGCLERVAADFSRPDCPAAVLRARDAGLHYRIGPASADPAVEVSGPARQLLAWLIGRSAGQGLTAYPAGQLPSLPAW
jgi:maleylpyruvate isomerase